MNRTTTAASAKSQTRRLPEIANVRRDVADLDRRVRRFAREQPLLCLAMAMAGGYLVGRIVSRL